jgi:hypothetical protein
MLLCSDGKCAMNEKTATAIAGLYAFYDRELSEFAIEVWADALAEFDQADVRSAIQAHIRDPDAGRWLPKPADLIRKLRGSTDDAAQLAWGRVLRAAQAGGGSFDGPAGDALDSLGGMAVVRRADESQNGFMQRRFVDAFMAHSRRAACVPLLAGAPLRQLEVDHG